MKKFISKTTFAILSMAFASTATLAGPLTGVTGYDPVGGDSIGLSASAVKDNAYTITLTGLIGVSFDELKGLTLLKTAEDVPTKKKVYLYAVPDGTTIRAWGLGSEWGDMSTELAKMDPTKAKATSKTSGSTVAMAFTKGAERCRVVTWSGEVNGQYLWIGHPAAWSTKNVVGAPITGWCFNGNTVVKLDRDTKVVLASKK